MNSMQRALEALPDTVIITDTYWYILDLNRAGLFDGLKKGAKLTSLMPDCADATQDEYSTGGRTYQRSVTKVYEGGAHLGYTVYLADVTEKNRLLEQNREKSAELERLTVRQARANEELAALARQAEALSAYSEQLRIAINIHDCSGHAITELHSISQMCLRLRRSDPAQYARLLEQGMEICERMRGENEPRPPADLRELLENFRRGKPFQVELSAEGEEPAFAAALYQDIQSICQEAYHNTLAHSMADCFFIRLRAEPTRLELRLYDNGSFRGALEKGFGLSAMEDRVRATGGSIAFRAESGEGYGIDIVWEDAP